ncbi:MAG: MATE family efflux transporter [Angelakisella sp.]|nr:MATE family efflux transporter [Angelakisella sp.]
MNTKRIELLSKEPVTKAILTMSIPVVLGMMIQVLYNLVDTFFIGILGHPNQLAAVNITTPLFMLMMAIAGIVGTGASSYISRCLGEKDYEKANKTLSTGIAICIGLGVLVTIIGSILISSIAKSLGASEETFPFVLDYSIVLFLGSVPIMCNYAIGQLLRSEGAAMGAMKGMLIGTVSNIILDPIFIFGFHMGIQGAAIATVLGNALGLAYYIFYIASGKSFVKFRIKSISLDKQIWKQIFIIGTPATISQILMGVAMVVCNNLAVKYGDVIVAGMGVAAKIMTIGTFVFMGFSAGCQPIVGYNFGAKNFHRMKDVIIKGMLITSGIGIVLTVIFGIFARGLIGVFTPLTDVVLQGTIILRALIWSLPFLGAQMIAATTVQAMGNAGASLFLSITRQGVFYIPLLLTLNNLFEFKGLIYAQPLSDTLTLAVAIPVLIIIIKKSIEQNEMYIVLNDESQPNIINTDTL